MKSIRHFRKLRGLSQAQLAELVACSQARISDIENGKVDVGVQELAQFAAVLGCERNDLITWTEPPADDDSPGPIAA